MQDHAPILLAITDRPDLEARVGAVAPFFGPIAKPAPELVGVAARASIRAIVTSGTVGAPAALIDALPNLKLISCLGSGFENVDMCAARARGIMVTHSPGANAASVADLAMGLMIASVRRIAEGDRFVRAGLWPSGPRPRTPRGLTGRNLGILGLGAIGEKIARRAAAFEMQVGYHNRHRRMDVGWRYFETVQALAAFADVLVIACRADESTRCLVDAKTIAALKPGAHVVNIARGSVIDEPALIDALTAGRIAGAGLDVFDGEPHVAQQLRALPNVVMTPHLAGNTLDAQLAMIEMLIDNLSAFLAGRTPPNPVPD